MATTTTSVSPPRQRSGPGRALAFVLIAVLVLILGALAWVYSVARSALPQLDGSLKVSGLSGRVRVIRDGHGVPTIDATTRGETSILPREAVRDSASDARTLPFTYLRKPGGGLW